MSQLEERPSPITNLAAVNASSLGVTRNLEHIIERRLAVSATRSRRATDALLRLPKLRPAPAPLPPLHMFENLSAAFDCFSVGRNVAEVFGKTAHSGHSCWRRDWRCRGRAADWQFRGRQPGSGLRRVGPAARFSLGAYIGFRVGEWPPARGGRYEALGSCSGRYRSASVTIRPFAQSGDCVIKGNINTRGEKIYHVLGQKYHNDTQISASHGERWFCSEAEARAAGWQRSRV